MGLFAYTLAGGGLILIGAWESLISTLHPPKPTSPNPSSSSITSLSVFLFSLLFILNSLLSLSNAHTTKDPTGLILQLQLISISSLFLFYSLLSLTNHFTNWVHFPQHLLNLLLLFAFIEEFLLFYLQRKDPSGIENRYFDLILVPVGVCVSSTILELKTTRGRFARVSRGVGLVAKGLWVVQMGFSFYSGGIAEGCFLVEKSRGNFTVKCRGHMEYHRARAIATLQFNCHLAFVVVLVTGVFSIVCKKIGVGGDKLEYKPIGEEMMTLDGERRFTLEDSDDDIEEERIAKESGSGAAKTPAVVTVQGVNGYGGH